MLTAKQSPRIENNCLYWYENNTWSIEFTLDPYRNGEPFIPLPTDKIIVTFARDEVSPPIQYYTFDGLEDLSFTLTMTEAVSKKFPKGNYVFGITYIGDYVTTICAKHDVKVESSVY